MRRALWLAKVKAPKNYEVDGEEAIVLIIKNGTLEERLVPEAPDMMTARGVIEWAELVRRVTTAYGANAVLIDASLTSPPLLLTLQAVLRPYKVLLQIIK